MHEYEEQQAIEHIALARHPEATGVKDIQPFLMTNERADCWLVILTTANEFVYLTDLVTGDDIRREAQ